MSRETVTITKKEYENLQDRDNFLCALEICGVDNWVGYDEAHKLFREWCNEVTDE